MCNSTTLTVLDSRLYHPNSAEEAISHQSMNAQQQLMPQSVCVIGGNYSASRQVSCWELTEIRIGRVCFRES